MATVVLLAVSVLIQFCAAFLALRLTRITGRRLAWLLVAGAIFLMGVRRSVTLVRLTSGDLTIPPDPVAEWIALVISVLMLAGIAGIGPLFESMARSEQALRRSETSLRQIIDLVPHMIFAKDWNGTFLLANQALAEAYDVPVETLGGRKQAEFQANEQELRRMLSDDREVMEKGEPKFIPEETFVDAQGRRRWLQTIKIPYVARGEGERAVLGVAVDITERKRFEQTIQERTAELERSNAELEQFAYVASHDLQAPLRAVVRFLQLLEEEYSGRLGAEGREYIRFAVDGGRRMQALIRDLLAYSRLGQSAPATETIDANAVFDEVVGDLRFRIDELGAVVTRGDLPPVECATQDLAQVFQNLLENALRFHGEAAPRVHVEASREGNREVFSVRDNGIGVEPDYADEIFEVFRRLHPPDEYPGTGIGLAVTKKLVERHGGRIWLEAEASPGATFCFSVPRPGERRSRVA